MTKKIVLFWSGGKDSALTYFKLKKAGEFSSISLLTTLDKAFNGIPFHGVKENLLMAQAKMLGVPLQRIYLPSPCSNQDYENALKPFLDLYKRAGITDLAFGDISLSEIKKFREELFSKYGFTCHFPLWDQSPESVTKEFFETGHRAIVSSIMEEKLSLQYLGKEYNQQFVNSLPEGINPAGENGEFHTFVSFSPYFKMRVAYSKGVVQTQGPYLVTKLQDA